MKEAQRAWLTRVATERTGAIPKNEPTSIDVDIMSDETWEMISTVNPREAGRLLLALLPWDKGGRLTLVRKRSAKDVRRVTILVEATGPSAEEWAAAVAGALELSRDV